MNKQTKQASKTQNTKHFPMDSDHEIATFKMNMELIKIDSLLVSFSVPYQHTFSAKIFSPLLYSYFIIL